jgi:hypothetical protein
MLGTGNDQQNKHHENQNTTACSNIAVDVGNVLLIVF